LLSADPLLAPSSHLQLYWKPLTLPKATKPSNMFDKRQPYSAAGGYWGREWAWQRRFSMGV